MSGAILVLGGAGFLGSRIARRFVAARRRVIVVDGLLPQTGGSTRNLDGVLAYIEFHRCPVDSCVQLPELLHDAAVIVDCMGWTCHRLAIRDPEYDAKLNLLSHLSWLPSWKPTDGQRAIYLGSRGQYGNPKTNVIDESTPQNPCDIQGIHKVAAEGYFSFYSSRNGWPGASLRIPNCVGPNQPIVGEDIGLAGGMIRDLLEGKPVTVYGQGRSRCFVYGDDVAELVYRLAGAELDGFEVFNCPGRDVALEIFVERAIERIGSGFLQRAPLAGEVAAIDMGTAQVDGTKLERRIGTIQLTSLDCMLENTIDYFRAVLA